PRIWQPTRRAVPAPTRTTRSSRTTATTRSRCACARILTSPAVTTPTCSPRRPTTRRDTEEDGMGAVQMLARASGEFDRRLPDIGVPSDASTPCEGWTVRDLLQHVIVGNRIAVVMLEGRGQDEVLVARKELLDEDQIGDDPAAAFATSAAAQVAAFS